MIRYEMINKIIHSNLLIEKYRKYQGNYTNIHAIPKQSIFL